MQVNNESLGEGGVDVRSSLHDLGEGLEQLGARAVLGDIAGSAGFESAARKHLLRMHAEDQHGQPRANLLHLLQDFQPASAA